MKRLFVIAGLVAALAIASYSSLALAIADVHVRVDDPVAMSSTADLVSSIIADDVVAKSFDLVAYSIPVPNPECRGTISKEHANFCRVIMNDIGLTYGSSNPSGPCGRDEDGHAIPLPCPVDN